jgi:penicillin G amidase
MQKMAKIKGFCFNIIIVMCFLLSACDMLSGLPKKNISLFQRIADFKSVPLPNFNTKTDILWNPQGVPYIVSDNDADAAFTLGMVQAHLRLGQMEVARHIVQGRLSESLGVYFNDIDHTLRIVNFYKAVPDILQKMPSEKRQWLKSFVAGINYYKQHLPREPHDFKMFAFDNREEWHEEDTIALGKLGGTDLHWILIAKLLPLLEKKKPEALLEIEKYFYDNAQTGFDASVITDLNSDTSQTEYLMTLLKIFNKSGSNAYAISGKKSATNAPLFAADPHLGIFLPNFWLMAGIKSPSYHVVGMLAPGTPVFAFGRNQHLAWGGTNLRSIQSHFVDITDETEKHTLKTTKTIIKNRFWTDKTYITRESDVGVILSDSKLFPALNNKVIALKWLGHYPTDEITTMLNVAKAKNGTEFRKALKNFGLPAQNMVFADIHGTIGNVMATSLTNHSTEFPKDLWSTPDTVTHDYKRIYNATTLPALINPASGFVASANNIPVKSDAIPLISWYTTSDERIKRLQDLLSQNRLYSINDIMQFQRDTYSIASVALRDALITHLNHLNKYDFTDAENVIMALRDWDGTYNADSRGALLLEGFLDGILRPLYHKTNKQDLLERLNQDSRIVGYTAKLLKNLTSKNAKPIIIQGLNRARELGERFHTWGDIHTMTLGHLGINIPLIGGQYISDIFPASGNRETLMKTSSDRTPMPHSVNYGSNARQVSDLSHIDNNYFILLGGQDSFAGSQNYTDQVYLWRIGHYIQMPLSDNKIKKLFPFKTIFSSNHKGLSGE